VDAAWSRIEDDMASEVGVMCWWEYMYAVVVAVVAMIKSKKWMSDSQSSMGLTARISECDVSIEYI